RRVGLGVDGGDPQRPELQAPHDEAAAVAGVAGVEQLGGDSGGGDGVEGGVVAVDRLRPGGQRPAGGGLEDVGGEAPVHVGHVEGGGAGVAVEVDVAHLADLVVGHGRRHAPLGDGLVVEPV